ncbi:hypothetical protein U1Q18_038925 [Sarracenia purpurea var. burkii]
MASTPIETFHLLFTFSVEEVIVKIRVKSTIFLLFPSFSLPSRHGAKTRTLKLTHFPSLNFSGLFGSNSNSKFFPAITTMRFRETLQFSSPSPLPLSLYGLFK